MLRIRDDFTGTIIVGNLIDGLTYLKAGDPIPAGVTVDPHHTTDHPAAVTEPEPAQVAEAEVEAAPAPKSEPVVVVEVAPVAEVAEGEAAAVEPESEAAPAPAVVVEVAPVAAGKANAPGRRRKAEAA
jgi:hypothetical protein